MRTLSGTKPTGPMTLGRYLGAVKHWVAAQQEGTETFFFIADLHGLTTHAPGSDIGERSAELAALLVAVGVDPSRPETSIFIQSHVPGHRELAWLLECTTAFGELRRMTQFKEKSGERDFVSAGLFTYPALMAADILLYDIERVPVGDDQRQHLELTRDIARRFNERHGETFVVPEAVIPEVGARIYDLQRPEHKMSATSQSSAGTIDLLDAPDLIAKKIKRAVTDTENRVAYDRERQPGVANLLEILGAVQEVDARALADRYTSYGQLKQDCAEAVVALVEPFQARYAELRSDPAILSGILAEGAATASAIAGRTLERAERRIGLLAPASRATVR